MGNCCPVYEGLGLSELTLDPNLEPPGSAFSLCDLGPLGGFQVPFSEGQACLSWEAYPRVSPEAQISDKAETAGTPDSLGDLAGYRRPGPAPPPGDACSPAGGREPELVGWGLRVRSPTRPSKRWPARRAQRPCGGGARPAGAGVGARRAGRGWAPCSPSLLPFLSFFLRFSLSFFASAAGRGGGPCSLCCRRSECSCQPARVGTWTLGAACGQAVLSRTPAPARTQRRQTKACARGRPAATPLWLAMRGGTSLLLILCALASDVPGPASGGWLSLWDPPDPATLPASPIASLCTLCWMGSS